MDDSIISKLREKISQKDVITQNDIDYFYSVMKRFHETKYDIPVPKIIVGKKISEKFVRLMLLVALNDPKNIRDDGSFEFIYRVDEPLYINGVASNYFYIVDEGQLVDREHRFCSDRSISHLTGWDVSPGITESIDICYHCGEEYGSMNCCDSRY